MEPQLTDPGWEQHACACVRTCAHARTHTHTHTHTHCRSCATVLNGLALLLAQIQAPFIHCRGALEEISLEGVRLKICLKRPPCLHLRSMMCHVAHISVSLPAMVFLSITILSTMIMPSLLIESCMATHQNQLSNW